MARTRHKSPTAAELRFVEDAALVYEDMGMPRMAGRILGWMLICDPPQQSLVALAETLQASKASISTMTRLLEQAGILRRITLPGDRRDHVEIPPNVSLLTLQKLVSRMSVVRALAERGLAALAGAPPERTARLREMHAMYEFFERDAADLAARFEAHVAKARRAKPAVVRRR